MKTRIVLFLIIHAVALLICSQSLFAWNGETWGPISRETILRRASEMINLSWSPAMNISNQCSLDNPRWPYNAGTIYYGVAYNRYNDPIDNFSEFYPKVNSISCQYPPCLTSYGNECSGFVSIAWKLPKRYNTTAFDCDAKNNATACSQYNPSTDDYVTKLGEIGSGQSVSRALLPGDAFVKSGSHILLFDSLHYNKITGVNDGIVALEQTPPFAIRDSFKIWTDLSSYRPIRRNLIDEGNYEFVRKWGTQGNLTGQFNYPAGIAVDSVGYVYAADLGNDRIQKFDSNGNFITKWGSWGSGNGQFYFARENAGIAVNQSGYVYVTDDANHRIQKFDTNGNFISKWGAPCDYPSGCQNGQFDTATSIAADSSGYIYVGDQFRADIQKFNSTGGFMTKWGSFGSGNGQFNYPNGVAVDSFGNVYVADPGSNQIQKFTGTGGFITKWGSCCICDDCPGAFFHYPYGIAVDSSGNVYVADSGNHRIQKFDSNGNFITRWGSNGYMEDGKFQELEGVAVDSSLNVYVADTYNHRIQKFAPVSPYPSRPISLTATTVSSNQINLSWLDNSNNETGFTIVRKKGIRGTYSVLASTLANVTSFSDTTLSGPDTYYYAVYAVNYAGYSAYSNEASATIAQAAPAAPTNLSVTAVTTNQVVISWTDNSTTETGFKIERKTGAGGTYAQIATAGANATSYSDSGLTENTTYYYRVKASNAGGDSFYSNEASGTTSITLPAAPANLTASVVSLTQINLGWTDNSNNETGFRIRRKTGANGTYSQIATVGVDVTTFSDTGLSPNTTYYYKVRSYNEAGTSVASNEANATTQQCQLPVRIGSTYYSTLQAAYNAAQNGSIIQSQAITFYETLLVNRNISVTLQGGYDCNYATNSGNVTYLKGMIQTIVGGGTLTISNFNLIQQ